MTEPVPAGTAEDRSAQFRAFALLVGETGQPDPDFPVGYYELPPTPNFRVPAEKIALILVAEISGFLAVALPQAAWHRAVARRKLPASATGRVV